MKIKRLGIVGGLGTQTSGMFCLTINNRLRDITKAQPSIVTENVPLSLGVERSLINGESPLEMLKLLEQTVRQLERSKADLIAIPCNTVHTFIDQLREAISTPILSITEECARECKRRKLQQVGLVATKKSIQEGLHRKELDKFGIGTLEPTPEEQSRINEVVFNILDGTSKEKDREILQKIIVSLRKRGAEAIILGCTDLQNIVTKESDFIDTLEVLEEAVIKRMG